MAKELQKDKKAKKQHKKEKSVEPVQNENGNGNGNVEEKREKKGKRKNGEQQLEQDKKVSVDSNKKAKLENGQNKNKNNKKSKKENKGEKQNVASDKSSEEQEKSTTESEHQTNAEAEAKAEDGSRQYKIAISELITNKELSENDPDLRRIRNFSELAVDARIVTGLESLYKEPTTVQGVCWGAMISKNVNTNSSNDGSKDVVVISETGSGKTMGYMVPAIQKVLKSKKAQGNGKNKNNGKGKGKGDKFGNRGVVAEPSILVVAPTRELAIQIQKAAQQLVTAMNESASSKTSGNIDIKVSVVYGGVNKHEQLREISGADVIVCTPGRLLDYLRAENGSYSSDKQYGQQNQSYQNKSQAAVNLDNVEMLVLDEADRMLDKGFEADIKEIYDACGKSTNPTETKRLQVAMFSATWPESIRKLAREFLCVQSHSGVKITISNQSSDSSVNLNVKQQVIVMERFDKNQRLMKLLREISASVSNKGKNNSNGINGAKIIVFVLYKNEAVHLTRFLQDNLLKNNSAIPCCCCCCIHGDMSQQQRLESLERFTTSLTSSNGNKKNNSRSRYHQHGGDEGLSILIATDVAARGLDIPDVHTVINYTFPLTIDDYIHRIGRTGRSGKTGSSVTFFTKDDKALAGSLINVLRQQQKHISKNGSSDDDNADSGVPEDLLKFGSTVKKKQHSTYGAFYKEVDTSVKGKKIIF
ncbi:ATP-dependent RNA helicase DBP3 [Zancudomyces culisetae]|uniref:RNA helicase n=1 Tax=Zancudomyces culisetae TaxID=1213189 RepID=A0A1R1PXZ7_ZANCU|nr:ATP-dependent RNA helicase DBP3 [Zancudomyces culisetae]|eukprot:OMH85813.1 ATP-dependent RNA helicase DBP3 [Zancudomyces culisetae]